MILLNNSPRVFIIPPPLYDEMEQLGYVMKNYAKSSQFALSKPTPTATTEGVAKVLEELKS